jgi:hypothetical protein
MNRSDNDGSENADRTIDDSNNLYLVASSLEISPRVDDGHNAAGDARRSIGTITLEVNVHRGENLPEPNVFL